MVLAHLQLALRSRPRARTWREIAPTGSGNGARWPLVATPDVEGHLERWQPRDDWNPVTAPRVGDRFEAPDLEGPCGPELGHVLCEMVRGLTDAQVAELARALEETVTAAGRPACLRVAAVEALMALGTPPARRALGRMTAVTRRRVRWEGSSGDLSLLALLSSAGAAR